MQRWHDEMYAKLRNRQKEEQEFWENKAKISILEMAEGISQGKVSMFDKTCEFKPVFLFDNQFRMDLPTTGFEVLEETEDTYEIVNKEGISIRIQAVHKNPSAYGSRFLEEGKERIEDALRSADLTCIWVENSHIKINSIIIPYMSYKLVTSCGIVGNIICYIEGEKDGYCYSVHFKEEDFPYWKRIVIASLICFYEQQ